MTRQEILGREPEFIKRFGARGCGFIGKVVSYPAGKYEEMGPMLIDIISPHCMLILGKRGTGKSYTLGVLAEEFLLLPKQYSERISVILVDTMSVFHSLKCANTIAPELERMQDFGFRAPRGFGEMVRIFLPKLSIGKFKDDMYDINYDEVLQLPLCEVEISDWLTLFDLKPTDPVGVLVSKVIGELKRTGKHYGFDDIQSQITAERATETAKESLLNLFQMIERLEIFDWHGTPINKIVKGGQISVLDISYLGRLGGFDLRSLIIALLGRRLLAERTLYTTLQMQSEANLIDASISKDITKDHPIVYMMIDEAHLFIPAHYRTFASDVMLDWIKLGRHPGLSLILATQEPSSIHESAIRQADIIISHIITSHDDVEALSKAKQTFMTGGRDIQKIVATMEHIKGLAVVFDDKTRKIEMCMVRPRLSLHTGVDASAIPPEELQQNSGMLP